MLGATAENNAIVVTQSDDEVANYIGDQKTLIMLTDSDF
jgi:hypothetical protein